MLDLNTLNKSYLSETERRRVLELEPFDEWEEWHLANQHYMIMTAAKGIANFIHLGLMGKVGVMGGDGGAEGIKDNGEGEAVPGEKGDGKDERYRKHLRLMEKASKMEEEFLEMEKMSNAAQEETNVDGQSSQTEASKTRAQQIDLMTKQQPNICDNFHAFCDIKDFSGSGTGHCYYAGKKEKGISQKMQSVALEEKVESAKDDVLDLFMKEGIPEIYTEENEIMKGASSKTGWYHRFGHAGCQIGNRVLLIGGFGEQGNCHGRLKDLIEYDVKESTVKRQSIAGERCDGKALERLFHTCNVLSDGSVCVFGGRLSPKHVCGTVTMLREEVDTVDGQKKWSETSMELPEDGIARWRHTANAITVEGERMLT